MQTNPYASSSAALDLSATAEGPTAVTVRWGVIVPLGLYLAAHLAGALAMLVGAKPEALLPFVTVRFLLFVVTGGFWFAWKYRAVKNLRFLNDEDALLEFTPGWAIGSYFVPVLGLFRPYQAMREITDFSIPEAGRAVAPGVVILWWGAYWLDRFAFLFFEEHRRTSIHVAAVTGIVSGLAALWLVVSINRAQTLKAREMMALGPGV